MHFTTLHLLYSMRRSRIRKVDTYYLKGLLLDTEITVVSYYAPNKNPLSFLSHLFTIVDSHKKGTLIMLGDSNQVLYPILDKSPTPSTTHRLTSSTNIPFLTHGVSNTLGKKQYTHYSHPHKQFSCIDHLLININPSPLILNSQIIPSAWSDHNAILTTFSSLSQNPITESGT